MTTAETSNVRQLHAGIRRVPAPFTSGYRAAFKSVDKVQTPFIPERGHMYAPHGDDMSFRSINLPYVGDGWEITGAGRPDTGAMAALQIMANNLMPKLADGAWLIAGPGLKAGGEPSKGGVVQILEEVHDELGGRKKLVEVDVIVLDTTQGADEMFETFYKSIWQLYEQQMAFQFGEDFLEEIDQSILGTHNEFFAVGHGAGGWQLRTAAWLYWVGQHRLDDAELLEPAEDMRLPHEGIFIDAMTGGLAAFLFDPDNRVPVLRQ
ncbi:hypothetical protein [Rhizobium laguerreae]|uniref:hypothetical protein n=1 Tax=Rhizobium laguerreae TaxID=1076926 RepID=UPI001C926905|nr:hypothetical protein [Rhizobium laguerreae]MBY3314721.1 hypothetical protein [Rhizobium laguerreae]